MPKQRKRRSFGGESALLLGKLSFPYSMRRRMEREEARAARLEGRALNAAEVMPLADRQRLRIEPNSDGILKLDAAYRQAKRDLKLRLSSYPSLQGAAKPAPDMTFGAWDLIFRLTWLAPSARDAKIWAMIMMYSPRLRARGKGEKTSPELKALLDFLTEQGFLCYDKAKRVYTYAPEYREALNIMRRVERNVLTTFFQQRPPMRGRKS